jgi:hypothetical protein
MARRAASTRKVLSETNLAALGADRLAAILMETAGPSLKRRLRLELAAEVGAPDLALEVDKRLASFATSKTRVSWRKRPETLMELRSLKSVILERLAPLDERLALDRLVAWFDLYGPLGARLQDPKGELSLMFDDAALELAELASRLGVEAAGPVLSEALATRFSYWAFWVGRGAGGLSRDLAQRLLQDLRQGAQPPVGRRAIVQRKLADRAGDLDAWIEAIPDADRSKPEVGAELARRLALDGRAQAAREALNASDPRAAAPARWEKRRAASPPPPPESWLQAEIAVLEAEGRIADADQAQWRLFDLTLSVELLKDLLAKLPDFEDVLALDRAFEIAASHPDPMRGLAFLMNWPAHREAAEMIRLRQDQLRGAVDDVPLWAGRLAGRHPEAALLLLRARAVALVRLGSGFSPEVQELISECESLDADLRHDGGSISPHVDFEGEVRQLAAKGARRRP